MITFLTQGFLLLNKTTHFRVNYAVVLSFQDIILYLTLTLLSTRHVISTIINAIINIRFNMTLNIVSQKHNRLNKLNCFQILNTFDKAEK